MDEEQLRQMGYEENLPVGSPEMESERLDSMSAPIADEPLPELRPVQGGDDAQPMIPPMDVEDMAQTGAQFNLQDLDAVQTAEQFNQLTDTGKELFYLRHREKVAMTPKAAATYVLKRNEQQIAQKDPLYQAKLRRAEAEAIKAEREGRGEQFFANGWERYRDEKSGEMRMRIVAGSPAESELRNQSQLASNNAKVLIDSLNQAEAMVDSFGATGLIGQLTQGIDSAPAGVLRSKLDTATGLIAIDKLIELKRAGGTLGQVTEKELEMLKSMQGALRVGLPSDVLKPTIQSVRGMWSEVLSKMSEDDMKLLDGAVGQPTQATWTGEEKKVLGAMRYKYSDGSWRPTKPQQVK
jgi:hypothetical protein